MSIKDIEDIKRRKLFELLKQKTESGEGLNCFDGQVVVSTTSFYRRVSDFKDVGYRIDEEIKPLKNSKDGKEYKHYFLRSEKPDMRYKTKREGDRLKSKRLRGLHPLILAFERKRANRKAATCPVCDANHQELNRGQST